MTHQISHSSRHVHIFSPKWYQNFRYNQQITQSVRGLVHEIVSTPESHGLTR